MSWTEKERYFGNDKKNKQIEWYKNGLINFNNQRV